MASKRRHAAAPVSQNSDIRFVELEQTDLATITALEASSWAEPLRASESILKKRFDLGHIMLGAVVKEELVGLVSFSYSEFSPQDPASLPMSFADFATRSMSLNYNTAFAYNLNVHPDVKGKEITRALIAAALNRFQHDGCDYLLGVGRSPSYNGSVATGHENIKPSVAFKETVDSCMRSGRQPTLQELIVDPVLRFYYRTLGCTFIRIMPAFLPGDKSSGGFGVSFYRSL